MKNIKSSTRTESTTIATTTTTTTTLNRNVYRFSGSRYGLRGTNKYGPDDIIPEDESLYARPREFPVQ